MYRLPTFNLTCNIWHVPNQWPLPPDLVVMGNLTPGRRVTTQWWNWSQDVDLPSIFEMVLLPKLTDVRDVSNNPANNPDQMEVPAGTKRLYIVQFQYDIAKGFPNEHRCAIIQRINPFPTPTP
jgi:hypothetical protein